MRLVVLGILIWPRTIQTMPLPCYRIRDIKGMSTIVRHPFQEVKTKTVVKNRKYLFTFFSLLTQCDILHTGMRIKTSSKYKMFGIFRIVIIRYQLGWAQQLCSVLPIFPPLSLPLLCTHLVNQTLPKHVQLTLYNTSTSFIYATTFSTSWHQWDGPIIRKV